MKKFFFLLICMSFAYVSFGQSGFSYQSIVRNESGIPQADVDVFLRFTIRDLSSAGPSLYSETQTIRTDEFGWLSATVGNGVVVSGDINAIQWSSGSKFLSVECAENQNGDYQEIATSQINNSIFTGPRGPAGPQGVVGPQGPEGAQGPAGSQGPQGQAGTGVRVVGTVPDANSLDPNYQGQTGDMVITEDTGAGYVWNGSSWTNVGSIQGPQGPSGPQGLAGPQGPEGQQGAVGPQGPQGQQGMTGAQGPAGPQGATGPQGEQGPAGPTGMTGPQGDAGSQGAQGPAGPQGAQGTQGPQGMTGAQGPIGMTGPQGANGPAGPAGPSNTLAIGTVTSGASPAVTITGTSPNQVLNFTLQQGAIGPQGPQGPIGPAGTYTAGTGISIASNTISAQNTSALWNANQLQGRNVWDIAPVAGQVLTWSPVGSNNPNSWQPASLPSDKWSEMGNALFPALGRHVEPFTNNAWDLGNATFRWRNIFLNNQPNVGSDRRIKENIKPLTYGLDAVMKFQPVQYNLIGNPKNDVTLGLIAQDVKVIIPEIVSVAETHKREGNDTRQSDPNAPGGMHSIRYGDLIPVLIKAIQEQQATINELKAKVTALENK